MFRSCRLFTFLAFGFALSLIASACGGTSSSSTGVADQQTTTIAAAVDDTTTTTTASTTTSSAPVDHGDDAEDPDHDDDESAHDDADAGDADRVVAVAMDDFSFNPANFAVTAGETVTFVVTNVGVVEHEFRLSNEHRIEEHMADGHSDDDHDDDAADDGGHHEDADMFLHLEAGASGEITVTFPMDMTLFTEVACLIPGHYEAGMAAELEYNV